MLDIAATSGDTRNVAQNFCVGLIDSAPKNAASCGNKASFYLGQYTLFENSQDNWQTFFTKFLRK
jgi:hypothetical protein